MKIVSFNGTFLIKVSKPFLSRSKFDSWPSHGNLVSFPNITEASSGLWCLNIVWTLKPGATFFYFCGAFETVDEANARSLTVLHFVPSGYGAYAIGEGYNAILRSQCFAKVAAADLAAFLAAN